MRMPFAKALARAIEPTPDSFKDGRRQAAWPVTTSILAGWPGMNVAV